MGWRALAITLSTVLFGQLLLVQPAMAKDHPSGLSSRDAGRMSAGIKAFQQDKWKTTLKKLKPFLKKDNPLPDYVLYMTGTAYLSTKKCKKASPLFQSLRTDYPDSRFLQQASLGEAKALLCVKKYEEARTRAKKFLKTKPRERAVAEATLLIAESYYQQGNEEKSVYLLTDFWIDTTSDDLAAKAKKMLGKLGMPPGPADQLRRARHLYKQREWVFTKEILVDLGKQDSFMFAECIYRLRDYPRAKKLFQSLVKRGEESGKSLARLATVAARTGDYKSAIEHNRRLAKKYPRSRQQKSALKKIAFLHKDSFEFSKAAEVLAQLLVLPLSRKEKTNTLAELAWVQYRNDQFDLALATLDRLLEMTAGRKQAAQFWFWKGKILKKMNEKDAAKAAFEEAWTTDKWSYYGLASLQEMHKSRKSYYRALNNEEQRRARRIRHVAIEPAPSTGGLFHLPRAEALTHLGLKRMASQEMRSAYNESKKSPAMLKRVAMIAFDSGNYNVPMVIALYKPGMMENPADGWRWMYPAAYQSIVERHAKRHKLDPRLVYSMMRQESAFKEHAVSSAGARGLIQIMPFTGKRLARNMGWKGFQVHDLYEPEVNIALSALYLRMNSDLFENRFPMVIASYNAGEAAVQRWLPSRMDLEDWEFIEEIPYKETNDYTKKVMRNYWMYQYLYPNSAFDKESKPSKKKKKKKKKA